MRHTRCISSTLALVGVGLGLGQATRSALADDAGRWYFDSSLNLFMAGMSGDVTAKGIPASLDASFGDVMEHLEAAVAGRVTLGRGRWFLSTEFSYLNLEASTTPASANLKQWLVEPSVGYSFCPNFSVFAGTRYNSIDGDVTLHGPVGRVTVGTQDWWDPIVGGLASVPLIKETLSFDGRFDVGGFGAGSDFTWQAYPFLNWHITEAASLQVGYRWLGTDYETGSGTSRFRYDVVVQGPQVGLSYRF